MSENSESPKNSNEECKRGFWRCLFRPHLYTTAHVVLIGIIGGIIIWGGLNTGMEYTNRTDFCLTCHEMRIPYQELQKTVHYKSRSGAQVGCADCHVASSKTPIDYARKMTMKVLAARDIIGHIRGIIDTPEKYEAHRLDMAKRVWEKMKTSDSKECRNCHNFNNMDPEKQKDRSVVKHESAVEDGKTCIDCHKGIAHKPVHEGLDQEEGAAAQET